MRKFILPLALLGAASMASLAMAADTPTTTNGAIKSLDAKACTVTLDNDTVYHFDAGCDFSKLSVGEKVAVTWAAKDNADWASKIEARAS